MSTYQYRLTIGFEDTNIVGNVYFSNFLRWQGKCRELFIKEHCAELMQDIFHQRLALVTLECSCKYFSELNVFDDVIIEMSLVHVQQHRIKMHFDYCRIEGNRRTKVAIGSQEIGCYQRSQLTLEPVVVPTVLRKALEPYEGVVRQGEY